MFHALDHVIVAVDDLDAEAERLAALLGRGPSWRGEHPGAGTRNVLFRLANTYVELLAGAPLERGLAGLAFGCDDIDACVAELRARGLHPSEPRAGEGKHAESGAVRRWANALLPLSDTRGVFCFAIEHRSEADALPAVAPDAAPGAAVSALDHVVIQSPAPDATLALYRDGLGLRLALDRSFPTRGVRLLFFRVGGATVEIGARLDADPDPDAADRLWGAAWRVEDVDAAWQRLRASFDVSERRDGNKAGTRVFTVRDAPAGVPTLVIGPA